MKLYYHVVGILPNRYTRRTVFTASTMSFYNLLTRIPQLFNSKGDGHTTQRYFPATLPKTLHREHCQTLPLGFLVATPKADGQRVLIATNGCDVWSLDRVLHEVNLTGSVFPAEYDNISVFDAERVLTENGGVILLLFDCLAFKGQFVTHSPLYIRLGLVRWFCNKYETNSSQQYQTLFPSWIYKTKVVAFANRVVLYPKPFLLAAKVPIAQDLLLTDIPVDGWVFYSLNSKYYPTNSGDACWKYKPLHQLTIDFRIVPVVHAPKHAKLINTAWLNRWALPALEDDRQCPRTTLEALRSVQWHKYINNQRHGNYYLVVDIGQHDIPKLFEHSSQSNLKTQHVLFAMLEDNRTWDGIVECRFDHGNGWRVLHSREKTNSNRLFTVLDTVRAIEQPLTQSELFENLRRYSALGPLRCW